MVPGGSPVLALVNFTSTLVFLEMAKQKNKRKIQPHITSAVGANMEQGGENKEGGLDLKRLALMLFILSVVFIPLAHVMISINIDAMDEDIHRKAAGVASASNLPQHQEEKKIERKSAELEGKGASSQQQQPQQQQQQIEILNPSQFSGTWAMAMHFSKDYDSLGSKCILHCFIHIMYASC